MMKKQSKQQEHIMMTLEQLVPKDHELRFIDKHIDFSFIYEATKALYSHTGKPSIDPVNVFKIELINILGGYNSIRRTCRELKVNIAYRWFLSIPFSEETPHFSSLSKLYKRKFEENDVYQTIFIEIMKQIKGHNLLNSKNVYIDGTHIKASANKKKFIKVEIDKPAHAFEDEILEKINESRINDGMKPFDYLKKETKTIKVSTTDPECGYFAKGEKERQMAYVAQVACDENGYALDCEIVPGNVHDSQSVKPILERLFKDYDIDTVAADSAYKTGPISELILSNNALFFTAYKRPGGKKGYFKTYEFVYDEYYNQVLCPMDKQLDYKRTSRDGYKIYQAKKRDCLNCEMKSRCTTSDFKEIHLSVFHDTLEIIEDLRHSDLGKEVYKKRKEKIERLFADAKEKYGMRYTRLRGINRVRNHILLTLACMNIKKMALHLERVEQSNV